MTGSASLEAWYAAIGQVIVAAANLDASVAALRYTLRTEQTDRFSARALDRRHDGCRRAAADLTDDALRETILAALDQVDALAAQRNAIVHGWIRIGIDGRDAIVGRSSRSDPKVTNSKIRYADLSSLVVELELARKTVLDVAEAVAVHMAGG
jgi:hypothetical protein